MPRRIGRLKNYKIMSSERAGLNNERSILVFPLSSLIITGMNGKVVRKETNPDPYSPIYDKVNQYLNGRDGRLHNGHTCLLFALIVKYDNHNIHLNNLSIFEHMQNC